MYKVIWKDKFGFERVHYCKTLADAIDYNKTINKPDTVIVTENMPPENHGENLCLDGIKFEWRKDS